jgi:chromosome segregation ATPase
MSMTMAERAAQLHEKISALASEALLQAHLASMDAKDSWETVSKDLHAALQRVIGVGDKLVSLTQEGRVQAELALMEAKDRWQALRTQLDKLPSGSHAKDKIVEEMQSLLGKLEEQVSAVSNKILH